MWVEGKERGRVLLVYNSLRWELLRYVGGGEGETEGGFL